MSSSKPKTWLAGVAAALSLFACAGGSGGGETKDRAAKATAIAKEIRANPDDAKAVLEKHGMTAEELEALMFEIANDPELSAAYTQQVEQ